MSQEDAKRLREQADECRQEAQKIPAITPRKRGSAWQAIGQSSRQLPSDACPDLTKVRSNLEPTTGTQ